MNCLAPWRICLSGHHRWEAGLHHAGRGPVKLPTAIGMRMEKRQMQNCQNQAPQTTERFDSLGACSPGLLRPAMSEVFKDLEAQGIPVVEHVAVDDPEAAWEWIEAFDKRRASLAYPCDGVVLSVNTLAIRGKLGNTGHSPRWAVAYKYPAEQATTEIRSITVQIGRTGRATPVAELEPVRLAGTTVSRATLHNQDEITKLGVHTGAKVVIEKGGEIIPKVVRVAEALPGVPHWVMPPECPECQHELHRAKGEANHYCTNPMCPAKGMGWLLHWVSRDVMNVQEFGPAIAETLMCQCHVKAPADLYQLSYEKLTAAGIGEKTARNLMVQLVGTNPENPNVWVFAFPLKAPETAWINDGVGATQMLENWLAFKRHYTEHNPSITVYVRPEEWIAVGNWVYEHWDEVGGLAFLPKDDHVYPLAPITPLTRNEYEEFAASFPVIPWEKFPRYEQSGDYAPDLSREYACVGDICQR